ncbi:MAG TPA: hypothetical protein VN109_07890, partial [Devosia sp.]|nr:hypothetical protein [Devosia sp.]
MTDFTPVTLSLAAPPARDRRIVLTASVSVLLHLALLAVLVLPRLQPQEAGDPPPITVELVPPSAVPSLEPSLELSSSEPPSSQEPSSASASAPASSSELPSSAEPASAAASSAPASSAMASAASSERPASEPASSEALASSSAQPIKGARPVVIPVGPSEVSSDEMSSAEDTASASGLSSAASEISSAEASSEAASDQASALTTTDTAASDATGEDSASAAASSASDEPPPPGSGLLHAAKRFYLAGILDAPGMARAKAAIKQLPPQRRLVQTCNIEAIGQIGNAGRHYRPDAL